MITQRFNFRISFCCLKTKLLIKVHRQTTNKWNLIIKKPTDCVFPELSSFNNSNSFSTINKF